MDYVEYDENVELELVSVGEEISNKISKELNDLCEKQNYITGDQIMDVIQKYFGSQQDFIFEYKS